MVAKIAVATVSGRAYYLLVKELKDRKIDFLSLTPFESVPLGIKVVLTTEGERKHINHPDVLVYEEEVNPSIIIDEAVKLVEGKKSSETLIVGVDPGKTFGLAVLNDGRVIKTLTCSSVEEVISAVVDLFERERQATVRILKIGSSFPADAADLLTSFDSALPNGVSMEIVQEAGTTRPHGQEVHKRRLKHVMAAIEIAERRGRIYKRKGAFETSSNEP